MTYSIFHGTRALQAFLEIFVALAVFAAWRWPGAGHRIFLSAESRFARFAARRRRAILAAALFPMTARALLLPFYPIPQPRVHDEFSYLLLGDTLAHGRVTNPAPPSWRHFETEYELLRPTYASQYQPAQGIMLAAGEVLTGSPWWGVWLSVGLMYAALCWALGRTLPPRWALFGAILAALQFGIFGFWMNSYFGGAVPAAGGAMVFGALARRSPITSASAAMGAAGILIVLASRPAEGLIWLGAAVCIAARRRVPKYRLASALAVLTAGLGGLGCYNAKITGNALELPYELYRGDYGTPQSYWWQPPVLVAHFDTPELAANYQNQLQLWRRRYSAAALWDATWRRARDAWRFFVGPFLTPALLAAAFGLRSGRLRPWLWVCAAFLLDHATYHAWYPQQSAPETVLIVFFLVEGWRRLRVWRGGGISGRAMSRNLTAGFATACAVLSCGLVCLPALPANPPGVRRVWDTMTAGPDARAAVIRRLSAVPGKHLVFVRYGPAHPWYDEWVFNGADIAGSRVVFARLCTPDSDRALVEAMNDRDVWIVSPDTAPLLAKVTSRQLLLASARAHLARPAAQSD